MSDSTIFLIKLKSIFIGIIAVASGIGGFVLAVVMRNWIFGVVGVILAIVLKYYADYIYFKYQRRCGHIIHYG